MTDTPALAAVHRHVEASGAKRLLVGDHRQLAAGGAGGGMNLLAQAGARYELADGGWRCVVFCQVRAWWRLAVEGAPA